MDCGIPFCHNGCPLGNLIPEWNDLVWRQDWQAAAERLHATNNFPEFTGRLCPAPCETACVLGINADPVTIKQVEVEIIDRALAEGWVAPGAAVGRGGRSRAQGRGHRLRAGRAGRGAAAHPGRPRGDRVRAGRRARRPAPVRDPRVQAGEAAPGPAAGAAAGRRDGIPVRRGGRDRCQRRRAAPRATTRSCWPAGPPWPAGCRYPAPSLTASTRPWSTCRWPTGRWPGRRGGRSAISARGRHVVIIGGGDTGADCLGTALRQGAASVTQLEIMPRPPQRGRPASRGRPTR